MCKWIINFRATKHVNFHRMAFDTFKVIDLCYIYLDDDSVVEAIIMGPFVLKIVLKYKTIMNDTKYILHVCEL